MRFLFVALVVLASSPVHALLPVCGGGANAITSTSHARYTGADVGSGIVLGGTAEVGVTNVSVTLNGGAPNELALPGTGAAQTWSLAIDAATFEALADGPVVAAATVTRADGSLANAGSLSMDKNVEPPGPPANLSATPAAGEVALGWENPADSDFQATRILRSTAGPALTPDAASGQTVVYEGAGGAFVDKGLLAATTYHYTAFAKDTGGNWSTGLATSALTPDAPPPPQFPTTFADNFDACTSTTDLGASWTTTGRWYCASGRARGEVASSVAFAHASPPADQLVRARVTLTGVATASGVVARFANGAYYAVRVLAANRVEVVRVNGGSVTVLGSVAATVGTSSHALALSVAGASPVQLTASFDGRAVLSVTDGSPQRLASGGAGLLSGTVARTQFDDFSVQ